MPDLRGPEGLERSPLRSRMDRPDTEVGDAGRKRGPGCTTAAGKRVARGGLNGLLAAVCGCGGWPRGWPKAGAMLAVVLGAELGWTGS